MTELMVKIPAAHHRKVTAERSILGETETESGSRAPRALPDKEVKYGLPSDYAPCGSVERVVH